MPPGYIEQQSSAKYIIVDNPDATRVLVAVAERVKQMARILVMDDDDVLRGALRVVLEAAGYDVLDAGDGEAGLRLQREQGADLVLVDIFMPKRDGLGVIQALRASDAQPKIVAMSGGGHTGQQEVLTSATAVGASRTLRKPFQPRELLTAIREVLNESRP
jgi:DNA-binding response OmpR family regulator